MKFSEATKLSPHAVPAAATEAVVLLTWITLLSLMINKRSWYSHNTSKNNNKKVEDSNAVISPRPKPLRERTLQPINKGKGYFKSKALM